MLAPGNCIRLCPDCPIRAFEGTSEYDPVTGDLVSRQPHYINARLEFVRDPFETPDIPTQEFGVAFVDTEGNKTSAFMPGVQLEDIAACDKPVVTSRSGFLYRKKHYDCGAQALKLAGLRKNLK
jgi:hypothetical protein